jgi:DNA polymerase III delta subunit
MYSALSTLNDYELASEFNVKPYSITVSRKLAAGFSKLGLKKIVDRLALLEYRFKSGVMSDKSALELAFTYLLTI